MTGTRENYAIMSNAESKMISPYDYRTVPFPRKVANPEPEEGENDFFHGITWLCECSRVQLHPSSSSFQFPVSGSRVPGMTNIRNKTPVKIIDMFYLYGGCLSSPSFINHRGIRGYSE